MITGTVVHGKALGRTIGFPTANILPDPQCTDLGPFGVYIAEIVIEGDEKVYGCMVNRGSHPTAPGGDMTIEAYICAFDRDIYGKRVTVTPRSFIRPETTFPSLDALKAQLTKDRRTTMDYFGIE
ncbi:MAG: riboflavin kinase [Clostridia bacterium]|nr:riboflavin kinase [Clostridia bacterium]